MLNSPLSGGDSNSTVPAIREGGALAAAKSDAVQSILQLARQHEEAERTDNEFACGEEADPAQRVHRSRQQLAFNALIQGNGIQAAARIAGVSRMTLYRWMKFDECFRSAVRRHGEEQRAAVSQQLLAMTSAALCNLREAVAKGHVGASIAILKSVGALAPRESATAFDPPADATPKRSTVQIRVGQPRDLPKAKETQEPQTLRALPSPSSEEDAASETPAVA